MNRGKRAVGLHNHIRAKAADVASDAVPIERVSNEVKVLQYFKVEVDPAATAGNRVRTGWRHEIAVNLETAGYPSGVHVKQLSAEPPVESRFRDDVGMKVRNRGIDGGTCSARAAAPVVELSGKEVCGAIGGKNDGTWHKLLRVFEGNAE